MKCVICKSGTTAPSIKSFMLEKGNTIVIVKGVHAQVCNQCGECYFDAETTAALYSKAADSLESGAELEVIRLDKAA
jgi:YgiT-type zinc finger domain-containing protein